MATRPTTSKKAPPKKAAKPAAPAKGKAKPSAVAKSKAGKAVASAHVPKKPLLAMPAPMPMSHPDLDRPLLTRRGVVTPLKLKAKAVLAKERAKKRAVPPPPPPPPKPKTLEERMQSGEARLTKSPESFRKAYIERFNMSWIYHDAALEGTVYTRDELAYALDRTLPMPDTESNIEPICEEIRRHREAIDWTREMGTSQKKVPLSVDTIRKLFLILHPEEGELKLVRYRKDVPQHRLYFHEYAAPDKIPAKLKAIIDWLHDPETKKSRSPLRIAARAHYDIVRVFPFAQDSGKVARLFMNILLLRAGMPPAIIHSADRQKYYEALKGSPVTINQLVHEAIENAVSSIEKLLEEHETKTRSFL